MPPENDSTPTKAELAAAVRAARRAAEEANALRQNLLRRKTQSRARTQSSPAPQKGAK